MIVTEFPVSGTAIFFAILTLLVWSLLGSELEMKWHSDLSDLSLVIKLKTLMKIMKINVLPFDMI